MIVRLCWTFILGMLLLTSPASAVDVRTISNGEKVDLTAHLATGKLTLVDFYADWCGPCRSLEPTLARLAATHEDQLALRKVDLTNRESPVAAQYGIRSIPHLKLYDGNGKLVSEGNAGAVLHALESLLGRPGSPTGGSPLAARSDKPSPLPAVVIGAGVLIAAILYFRRNKETDVPSVTASAPQPGPPPVGSDLKVRWLVMVEGSLEGPFSAEELDNLRTKGLIDDTAKVRRRGDSAWKPLADILRESGLS